jgi:hypothetical protein
VVLQLSKRSSERVQMPQDLERQEIGKTRIIRKMCKLFNYAEAEMQFNVNWRNSCWMCDIIWRRARIIAADLHKEQ